MKFANLFTRIFVATAIPFGLCMFLLSTTRTITGNSDNFLWPIATSIGGGLFFGILMAATLGWLQYFQIQQVSNDAEIDLAPSQKRVIELPRGLPHSYQLCLMALDNLSADVVEANDQRNYMTATTRASWKSYGEEIRIALEPINPANTRITITSKPKLAVTLVDYGKGFENVQYIATFLASPPVIRSGR